MIFITFENFKSRVRNLLNRAGGNLNVRFHNDTEKGKYYANCSDGTVIIGRPSSLQVTVRFGAERSHQAVATI